MHKKLGLIGGLAIQAGIFYYEQIQQRYGANEPPLQLIINHADISRVLSYVMAGEKKELGSYLGKLANELADAGCEIFAITAVAPHLAVSEIAAMARIPIVNVLETISAGVAAAEVNRIAIFGNRAVMLSNAFGALSEKIVVRLESDVIDRVHAIYSDIAQNGKRATQPETEDLSRLAHQLISEKDVQAILLAGTDLSSFYADQKPDFPFLDVAQLHIDRIIDLCSAS